MDLIWGGGGGVRLQARGGWGRGGQQRTSRKRCYKYRSGLGHKWRHNIRAHIPPPDSTKSGVVCVCVCGTRVWDREYFSPTHTPVLICRLDSKSRPEYPPRVCSDSLKFLHSVGGISLTTEVEINAGNLRVVVRAAWLR